MLLAAVESGHDRVTAGFLRLIGWLTKVDMPDIVKVTSYRHRYFGTAFTDLVQTAMRGPSFWTVAERELFAARTSKANTCPFCVSAHQSVAASYAGRGLVDAAMDAPDKAPIRVEAKAVLALLDQLADPDSVDAAATATVRDLSVPERAIEEAVLIAVLFHVINRVMNGLGSPAMEPAQQQLAVRNIRQFGYRNPPPIRLFSRAR